MAPRPTVRNLQRNVRPAKISYDKDESEEDYSGTESERQLKQGNSSDGSGDEHNDVSEDGEELQASRDARNLKLRHQQNAESDDGRSMGESESEVEDMGYDHNSTNNGVKRQRGRNQVDEVHEDDEQQWHDGVHEVSFGALKKAQDSLGRNRNTSTAETNRTNEIGSKRKRAPATGQELDDLRKRMKGIKGASLKEGERTPSWVTDSRSTRNGSAISSTQQEPHNDNEVDESDSGSDSAPSEEGGPGLRSSKHAPAAQSSKYQVTRKRQVIDVPKRVTRDPRFDAFHQPTSGTHKTTATSNNVAKAYDFLNDYRTTEIKELKAAIKSTKSAEDKENLKRALMAMENRQKAREAKEREQEVVRKHRKEERERISQGKNPYYLKDSEIKQRALVEKFKGMKGKDREKIIEKRRKKEGQKEKKRMPQMRRGVST